MNLIDDLSGRKFGKLTVLKYSHTDKKETLIGFVNVNVVKLKQ